MVSGTRVPQGTRLNPRFTREVTPGLSVTQAVTDADNLTGDWTILLYPGTYVEGDITPNGGANITIKAMGEGRVVIAPVAAPAAGVIVSGNTLTLIGVTVTAPDATMPPIRVTGGTLILRDCDINGVGAGDAIQQIAGTVELHNTDVAASIDLSTADYTLTAVGCNINGTIDTADAFDHSLTLRYCSFNDFALGLAATGACTYSFQHCTQMGGITDESLLGGGSLYQCDCVGSSLIKNGTSPWIVEDSVLMAVSNTDATGAITITGGVTIGVTRAVGPVVWWQDGNTLKAVPSGTITDTMIGWAVAAAAAGDTIVIHPGTYEEAVILAAGINLKGLDKEACIIDIDNDTLVTMAAGCSISSLTLNATGDITGNGIAVECNDSACTIEDCNINLVRTGSNCYAISEVTGATARVINLRNVRITSDTDTNESGIYCTQAGKTFFIEECWIQGGDYAIYCDAVSTFHVAHTWLDVVVVPPGGGITIYAAAATMNFNTCTIEKNIAVGNLGTIRLKNTSYREINRGGTGNIVDESPGLRDAPWHVAKWDWMAALASMDVGVRGTPRDAGSGQILLEVTDNVADAEAVEANGELAGSLANHFTPARTPRYLGQISADAFDPHVTMFFGLRETLGNAVPAATEDHAGFIWDGTNFKASSDDGVALQETNLTEPSTDTQHQLEAIVFGGVTTVGWVAFYVDGIIVATQVTRIPVNGLDWQHLLATAGGGGGDLVQVTIRPGGVQECPA